MQTDINIEFTTDQPMQVDRVLFEALQRAVQNGAMQDDLDILSGILIGAIRAENERWKDEGRARRDERETDTIRLAVAAGKANRIDDDTRKEMGTLRADKIQAAIDAA